jgi:hypothetical protein
MQKVQRTGPSIGSIGAAFALAACVSVPAGADIANLTPTQDVRILSFPTVTDTPEPNGFLSVFTTTGNNNLQRTLIQFDLSSIPAGSTINSATLTLNADTRFGGNAANQPMDLYRVTRPWTEAEVTWSLASTGMPWTTPGGDYVGTTGVKDAAPYATNNANPADDTPVAWNVTALAQEWVSGANANNGVEILSFDGNTLTFDSSELAVEEGGATPVVPTLTVDFTVPEPAGLSLLCLSGLALAGRRRRA